MDSPPSSMWLEVSREDFLNAIRRLSPQRMLRSYKAKAFEIKFNGWVATFSIEEPSVSLRAHGCWTATVKTPFDNLLTFTKLKPSSEAVRIVFDGKELRVGTTVIQATWAPEAND